MDQALHFLTDAALLRLREQLAVDPEYRQVRTEEAALRAQLRRRYSRQVRQAVLDAVDAGRITADRLDQSVRRILTLKQSYGLTSDPVNLPDLDTLNAQVDVVNGLV